MTMTDPEHELTALNSEVYWLSEALWEFLHHPSYERMSSVGSAAQAVAKEAMALAEYIKTGYEKGEYKNDDD